MRSIFALFSLLISVPAFAGYDASWYNAPIWSGEWPRGFVVTQDGFKVMARTEMDKEIVPTVVCGLPYRAVFHPWNHGANKDRQVEYWTASKIQKLTAKANFKYNFEVLGNQTQSQISLLIKKGELIEYLIYGAEGWFTVRISNKLYGTDQGLMTFVTDESGKNGDDPDRRTSFDEWIKLKCEDNRTAWVLVNDLETPEGQAAQYSDIYIDGIMSINMGKTGIDGYGQARDLTDEEIDNLKSTQQH